MYVRTYTHGPLEVRFQTLRFLHSVAVACQWRHVRSSMQVLPSAVLSHFEFPCNEDHLLQLHLCQGLLLRLAFLDPRGVPVECYSPGHPLQVRLPPYLQAHLKEHQNICSKHDGSDK